MTKLTSLALGGLAAVALAGSAQAFSFAPTGAGFSAIGSLTLGNAQASTKCTTSLKGETTKKGRARIDSVIFSGNSQCANTAATNLPWTAKATGANTGKILGVSYAGAFLGACGPGTITMTVSGSGVWSFSGATLPPACTISGSLPTSPAITIVP